MESHFEDKLAEKTNRGTQCELERSMDTQAALGQAVVAVRQANAKVESVVDG